MLEGPPSESGDDTSIIRTPEEAQRAVASLAALHVDFIKVHGHLSRNVYFAIASAAKKTGLPFAGHVTASISPIEASIEHFEFLPEDCVPLLGTDWSSLLESKVARPGSCLHDELDLLVAAGFSPLQAL